MIIFIPAYDDATKANLDVVEPIIPKTAISLLEKDATRGNLWHQLNQENVLFAMSHGNSDALWDNNDDKALKMDDFDAFADKKAFVFACFTANSLGMALKKQNSIYWGYTGRVAAPSSQPIVKTIFSNILEYILTHFSNCKNEFEINQMLENIKQLCDKAAEQMDEIIESGAFVEDDWECYNCLQHIWSRLRVHHFNINQPLKHIGAVDGDLYEWK
jgi:hypothetical protein